MKQLFKSKTLVIFFSVLLAIQLVWNFYLYTLPTNTEPANYWYNIMYGSTSIFIALIGFAAYYLGHDRKSSIARSIAFLSWGALANGLGLFYWAYNNIVGNIEIPYPSAGEYLFLLFPILMWIGFWMLMRLYRPLVNTRLVIEAILVTTVSSWIIFSNFIIPNLDPEQSFFGKFVTIAIPWEDAFTIALVYVALRVSGGKMRSYLWLFIISLLLLVAGDFTFQYRQSVETYWNGDIADLLYTINMYFFALGVIYTIESASQPTEELPVSNPVEQPAMTAPESVAR